MSNFAETMYKKYGFIYQIEDEYYAMGANILTKVTDMDAIDNLELLQNAVKKNNERQIAKYLDKVIRIANMYRVDATEHLKLQEKMFQFLETLESEKPQVYSDLQAQVFQFDELFAKYSKHNGGTI
ncbi:MAG: hypothetical protein IJ326_06440 [Lachnospiraceae bacterium]|nr:hypothetical protein [Lachnospiraceae bacterium]